MVEGSEKLLLLAPPGYTVLQSPPLPPSESTTGSSGTPYLACHPFASITPGRGQALISEGIQTASLVSAPSRGASLGQSGLHNIDTPRVLRNLALEEYPCTPNWIQTWRTGRAVGHIGTMIARKNRWIRLYSSYEFLHCLAGAQDGINLPQDRKKVLVKNLPVSMRGDGFLWQL